MGTWPRIIIGTFLDNGPTFSLPEIGVEPNVSEVMGLASKPFLSPGRVFLSSIVCGVNAEFPRTHARFTVSVNRPTVPCGSRERISKPSPERIGSKPEAASR